MRWPHALPLAVFAAVAAVFVVGLGLEPRKVPSALIDKPVPEFTLPPLIGDRGLSHTDLKGEVALVNVFASWCVPCRQEHPLLADLADKRKIVVHGINYKDAPDQARAWLNQLGNPYNRIGADRNGRSSIDWGVYGVPETFVIDRAGRIRYKHIGPLTPEAVEETLMPLLEKLRR